MSIFKPPRRWFAFSLRTLFVVLTIFACWLGWEVHVVRQRRETLNWIYQHDGRVFTSDASHPLSAVRSLFGDETVIRIDFFWGGPPIDKNDHNRIEAIFPEAIVSLDVTEIE